MARNRREVIGLLALAWAGIGAVFFAINLPGRLGYLAAALDGRLLGSGGTLDLTLFFFWIWVEIALMEWGWAVYRGNSVGRNRILWVLPAVWVISILSSVRGGLGAVNANLTDFVTNPWLLKDLAFFGLLLTPMAGDSVRRPGPAERTKHGRRVSRAWDMGHSWRRLGNSNNTVVIPVVFGSIVAAPFTYLAAGLYFLTVVLPLHPGSRSP